MSDGSISFSSFSSFSVASSTRRRFLAACSAAGVGGTLLPGVLLGIAGRAEGQGAAGGGEGLPKITEAMVEAAAGIAGVRVTREQIAMMIGDGENGGLAEQRGHVERIRGLKIPNGVAPAVVFDPVPGGMRLEVARKAMRVSGAPALGGAVSGIAVEAGLEGRSDGLAFATVRELAELVKARRVTSVGLTKLYLARLKRLDERLRCVITLTEARAMERAGAADREIAGGGYKGPLHGIPWGAKDLLAVKGYRTTWGAAGFEEQSFDYDAEVVTRLDTAGAVLVAKLTMGALASGDLWFGGRTRNPWNTRQGSSGSSAGSASAVAAGCVGFAIGTETLGSISSPSTRCGVTGLRPSFGLVPRTGAMALTWSMDKIGPICRSVEDCAMVLSAIYGPDGKDLSVKDAAFNWDAEFDWRTLRVGYFAKAFEEVKAEAEPVGATAGAMAAYRERQEYLARQRYDLKYGVAGLAKLRAMGVKLVPVEMPVFPFGSVVPVLEAEAAAAFDELTLSGRDRLLTGQKEGDWPNTFRVARFYSAVDYVQAMRARTLAVGLMTKLFESVDVIVTTSSGTQLSATNLTGQPAVIVPNGVRGDDAPKPRVTEDGAEENVGGPGTPVSLTFLGGLYTDARLAGFARAYQEATGFHLLRPKLG